MFVLLITIFFLSMLTLLVVSLYALYMPSIPLYALLLQFSFYLFFFSYLINKLFMFYYFFIIFYVSLHYVDSYYHSRIRITYFPSSPFPPLS